MALETKVTHTPGPWSCNQRGLSVFATRDHQQERIAKAELLRGVNGDDISADDACEEEQANAHLIAAAPDMLEALENLENDDNSIPEHAWKIVQDAIRKAKGRAA